jgi:hypothetical protein
LAVSVAVLGAFGAPAGAHAYRPITEKDRNKLSARALLAFAPKAAAVSAPVPAPAAPAAPAVRESRWIEVRLAKQQLVAWQDGKAVMTTAISSGVRNTPTVRGSFRIRRKYASVRMRGPGYDLPNVPFSMFFHAGYAMHGTYWHNSFGRPMSHGCVNMPTSKARWLYNWAPVGTLVVVH